MFRPRYPGEPAPPLPASGLCKPCEEDYKLREGLRLHCGVSPRHEKLACWEELEGPPEYLSAVSKAKAFAERGDSILALVGARGLGKTQIGAVAVQQEIETRRRSARIATAIAVLADLKAKYSNGSGDAHWFNEWGSPQLLVLDEFAEVPKSDHGRSMLTALADLRYQQLRPTIVVANCTPNQLVDVVGPSIADRCCEGGGIVLFQGWPSFRSTVHKERASAR